ncbi:hypothetical protein AGMMS50239_41350 [Bacteroidia bacterium]|nr:hypothetical protein AGMMS50239_41350 [Bacteroidia bacterium]
MVKEFLSNEIKRIIMKIILLSIALITAGFLTATAQNNISLLKKYQEDILEVFTQLSSSLVSILLFES